MAHIKRNLSKINFYLIFQATSFNWKRLKNLKAKAKTIFGEQPQRIDEISQILYERVIGIEANEIWKKIIVGKADVDIAKLIQRLNINDWVNQGKNILKIQRVLFANKKQLQTTLKLN